METINVVLILLFLAFVVAPLIILILIYSLGSQLTSLAKENAKSKPEPPKPEPPKPEPPKPETPKPEMNNLLPPVIPKPAPNTTKYTCPAVTSGCKWEKAYQGEDAACGTGTFDNSICNTDIAKNDCASWGWKFAANRKGLTVCYKTEPDTSLCKWSDTDPVTKIKKPDVTNRCTMDLTAISCSKMNGEITNEGCLMP
jgi:hypothetical protein